MLTEDGPKVLEYNARFGDPEAQVVIPRMRSDLVEAFEACIDGRLEDYALEFEDNAAVCVVLASDGYPVHYEKGLKSRGLKILRAGTAMPAFTPVLPLRDGKIVTNGGRVLGITATGPI